MKMPFGLTEKIIIVVFTIVITGLLIAINQMDDKPIIENVKLDMVFPIPTDCVMHEYGTKLEPVSDVNDIIDSNLKMHITAKIQACRILMPGCATARVIVKNGDSKCEINGRIVETNKTAIDNKLLF